LYYRIAPVTLQSLTTNTEADMSKAQELVDYLNARIAATGYNHAQFAPNPVFFSVQQGRKYARIVKGHEADGPGWSAYAFVDANGYIYKAAGWSAPAKGARAKVDDLIDKTEGGVPFFNTPGEGFDLAAYSTSWLYA
jgi:hypothetical protein